MKRVFWEPGATSGEILIIQFQPFSFFDLFNLNPEIFTSKPVHDFCEITGNVFKSFITAFYNCVDLKQKVNLIESFISNRRPNQTYPHLLKEGIRYIQDKQGDLSVKELSFALGLNLSYKWWERTFKRHLGMSPQRYIQSQRFLYTYIELDTSPKKELIEVALNNGYCDMNHLVKNFREYTGEPPRTFFRKY
nr:helix-turn-helix domain-containing protein [Pedobacter xinjiangensis]